MNPLAKTASRLKYESSFIFALLLTGGVVILVREPQSLVGVGLVVIAISIGVLGFIINSIRENYENVIKHKDEMIKSLTRERKNEIKHSEDLRKHYEAQLSGGWEPSHLDPEEITS